MANILSRPLTQSSATPEHTLGDEQIVDGKRYRYVKNIDLTASNGWALCVASASDPNIVSGDATGGSAITAVPRGVAIGTLGKDEYGWIQVSGYHSSVISDGSVAAGEALVKHATTDGGVDSGAAGSTATITVHQSFGLALADDTTSRVQALLNCI